MFKVIIIFESISQEKNKQVSKVHTSFKQMQQLPYFINLLITWVLHHYCESRMELYVLQIVLYRSDLTQYGKKKSICKNPARSFKSVFAAAYQTLHLFEVHLLVSCYFYLSCLLLLILLLLCVEAIRSYYINFYKTMLQWMCKTYQELNHHWKYHKSEFLSGKSVICNI